MAITFKFLPAATEPDRITFLDLFAHLFIYLFICSLCSFKHLLSAYYMSGTDNKQINDSARSQEECASCEKDGGHAGTVQSDRRV